MSGSGSGDYNHVQDAIAALHEGLVKAVKKAALDVEAEAKGQAPVDTGYLRNSVYTVTSDGSTYDGSGDKSLPEVAKPGSDLEAVVAVGANYGEYVEMGTRHMPAQPWFYPAADTVRGTLAEIVAALVAAELKAKLG